MDILLQAFTSNIMNEQQCNEFIKEVKDKKSKLVHDIDSITDYLSYKNKE
jgi:hypothetical protein